jgi:ATP-dependent Clp protease ATP-binding subunit ClpC
MGWARQEAQRLNSEFIGSEHILLGILCEGGGIAAKLLKNLHVDLNRTYQEIEKLMTSTSSSTVTLGQLPFSPRAKRVIELASGSSIEMGHDLIGTEHLLFGLLKDSEGIGAQVLVNLGLNLDATRISLLQILGVESSDDVTRMVPWSARTVKVAEKSVEAAERMGSREIDPEHLLLGILGERGPAATLLESHGVTAEEVLKLMPRPR